ncbi:MAG: nucleoside-triphosphatase [Clostridiales bacterium]|nr:nucleoside-triphosphatase [Clostridiales bacterium]
MIHLFLTGEVQVGKSTLIRRLLAAHPCWRLGGFRTVTRWEGRQGCVHLLPAHAGMEACTADNCVGIRDLETMRPVSRPEVFDRIGPELLRPGRAELLLMDELGTMERQAESFGSAVLGALDGDLPVLGVIKPRSSALLDAVRAHPRVSLITVTLENREKLLTNLEAWALENALPGLLNA